jgi:hypothetical protein
MITMQTKKITWSEKHSSKTWLTSGVVVAKVYVAVTVFFGLGAPLPPRMVTAFLRGARCNLIINRKVLSYRSLST